MPILERVLGGGRIEDAESDGPVRIEAVNDQHAFVRGPVVGSLRLGDVVRLGISHPCTAFDKWRVIATIEDSDDADPPITGAIATLF
jgi:D-serine deaminase-like pyridoxal phosphate-dependent protein